MTTTPTIWKAKYNPNFQNLPGEQIAPQSVGLANGNILTVWEDDTGGSSPGRDIMGQIFDPYGNSTGPLFQVNFAIVNQDETAPKIAALPDGGWVVAYGSHDVSLGDFIVVQRFDSSGAEVSNGRHFITDTRDSLTDWVVNVDNNGNYIVTFNRDVGYIIHGNFGDEHIFSPDVHAIVYDAISNNPGPERSVAQNTSDYERLDDVATFNDSNVITVTSEDDDGSGVGNSVEYMIWQSSTGNVVVPPVGVAGSSDHAAFGSSVAVLTGGEFVIVYSYYSGDDRYTAMRIGASDTPGAALSPEIYVSDNDPGDGIGSATEVVALNDGGFMLAWARNGVVHGTRYTADGTVVGTAGFQIATGASGGDLGKLSLTSDGRVLVTWRGSDGEIAEAIVDPRENVIHGTAAGEALTTQLGDTQLYGEAGDDTLYGLAGNDIMDGGDGTDVLKGGDGNDTYVLDDVHQLDPMLNIFLYDSVVESANGGADTVQVSHVTGHTLISYTLAANVENGAIMGTDAFNLNGNSLENFLTGNDAVNALNGSDGSDTLKGGGGADQLVGGNGIDTASYGTSGAGVAINLAAGTASGGEAQGDTLSGIENVIGSLHADLLTGDGGDNYLSGASGTDSLYGGLGNDTLDGGNDGDYLNGGEGGDTLYGQSGADTLDGGNGVDYLGGGAGTDSMYAGAGNDVMQGGDDGDYLDGSSGADTMYGEGGNDVMDAGADLSADADYMDGGDGNDTLYGRGGADTMIGGLMHDALYGDAGADYLFGFQGNDYLGGGADGDVMVGGDGGDTFDGGEGADYMSGETGADSMYAGDGNDVMYGGPDSDYLGGQNGSDTIYGEGGSDVLDGGSDSSNDYLDGGALGDAYIFGAGMGHDVIGTFDDGGGAGFEDYIYLDHNIVANFATLSPAMAQNGANVIINLGGFGAIQINSVTLGSLGADDFIFY